AMTMTPARAASIFASRKAGHHGDQGKEALPWWSFALFGALASVWLLTPLGDAGVSVTEVESAAAGGFQATLLTWATYVVFAIPGAVVGGVVGWFIIQPVNAGLGRFFRGFNWIFDRTTQLYGRTVGWGLRLSVIVLIFYVGLIGLTGFGFAQLP